MRLIRDAAREAEVNQSHREALTHLRAALNLVPEGFEEERAELLDEIAWQAASASDHTAGIPALRALEGLVVGDPVALGTVKMRLSSFLATGLGDLQAAEREASEAVRLFRESEAEDRLPGALNELAWIRGEGGDLEAQIEGSREALALAEKHGNAVAVMHALGPLGHGLGLLGRTEEAVAVGARGLEMATAAEDRSQIGWHTGVLTESLMNGGRLREAARLADGLLDAGPSVSDVAYFARARLNWNLGRWTMALSDCLAIQALHPTTPSVHSAWTLSLAGSLQTAMGDAASAEPFLAQAERVYSGRDFYVFTAYHDWALGCARWFGGEPETARDRLNRSVAQLERLAALPVLAQILPDLIEVALLAGDVDGAVAGAERLGAIREVLGDPVTATQASYGAGLAAVARRRATAVTDSFREAAARAAEVGMPFIRARSLEHLSGTLKGQERVDPLSEAARLYAALPAPAHEERAVASLRSLGTAGRRAAQGVGALTQREREVAVLAQQGLTSRAIAERLHVSERTVESHLAHIFRKLQVAGRKELTTVGPLPPTSPQ